MITHKLKSASSSDLERVRCASASMMGSGRVHLKRDGTRWRTEGEVKGKLANGVGRQYLTQLPRNMVYPALLPLLPLMLKPRLPIVDRTDAPADLNGLVRFTRGRNLVSARVPSHSNVV